MEASGIVLLATSNGNAGVDVPMPTGPALKIEPVML